MHKSSRRSFIKKSALAGISLSLMKNSLAMGKTKNHTILIGKRVGIIGLDTSHSIAFTKVLNENAENQQYKGYKVVAAYPYGSKDIQSSADRIPGYTEEVKEFGVEIVNSISDLLNKVDVVLLETNDGRLHLEQALEVLPTGKRMFIDKPMSASLSDAVSIFEAAKQYGVPVFSASSLRYIKGIEAIDKASVLGADTFSPAILEPTHPDLFWYGIHGVETLFTVMGTGCESVTRVHTAKTDLVTGIWKDGRIGTFRGTRSGKHDYGGTVFTENGNVTLGPYAGYEPLLSQIVTYFETGEIPVSPEETLEILAFMEAADESKKQGGKSVLLKEIMDKV